MTYPAKIISQKHKHHKGSIYCSAWNHTGDLIATGSNDKTIKMSRFNVDTCMIEGENSFIPHHFENVWYYFIPACIISAKTTLKILYSNLSKTAAQNSK